MTSLAGQQDRVEAEGVLDRSEVWWLRLREIIRTGSLKRGDLVLSSGRTNTRIGASNLAPSRSSRQWPQGAM
jgi:hypothetical protein